MVKVSPSVKGRGSDVSCQHLPEAGEMNTLELIWTTQNNVLYNSLKLKKLSYHHHPHCKCLLNVILPVRPLPGTLYFSCSASFFLPDGQLKLLLLILSTIRVYTPDLGYPITQKRVLLKIFPNKYK